MKFYLSGGMEYKTNLGMTWRDWLTGELEKIGHNAIDPVKLEAGPVSDEDEPLQHRVTALKLENRFDEVRLLVRKYIFTKDVYGIQLADALVLFYDGAVQKGAGTLSEAWESFREGRPIYMVTEFSSKDIPSWLIAETTQIFKNFEELLEYIATHGQVIEDMLNARKIRNEVLSGVY